MIKLALYLVAVLCLVASLSACTYATRLADSFDAATRPTVTITPTATRLAPTSTPTATRPAYTCLVVNASRSLYFRSGPSMSDPVIAWFSPATRLDGIVVYGNWWMVKTLDGRIGYVHRYYVKGCK